MIGSGASRPPFPVTLDNWQNAGQLDWTFQHMAEIFPTVPISRGPNPSARLLSRGYDAGSLPVVCNDGRTADVDHVMASTNTDGWMVVHDHPQQGPAVLVEQYPAGMDSSTLHLMMSVSKSVVGTVIGSLVAQAVVDPDALVTHYIPAFYGSGYDGATIRNLLDMRSGIRFSEEYLDPRPRSGCSSRPSAGRLASHRTYRARCVTSCSRCARRSRTAAPFDYRSCETDVLGWVVEAATGARFAQVASDLVWSRIGAEFDANIGIDSEGSGMFDGGMSATLGDLARFGLMILRSGPRSPAPRWCRRGGSTTASPGDPTRSGRSPRAPATTECRAASTGTSSGSPTPPGPCCCASASTAR